MRRLLLSLMHLDLVHELGTGRALDNARRERAEVARTMAAVDALVGRLAPDAPAPPVVLRPVAA